MTKDTITESAGVTAVADISAKPSHEGSGSTSPRSLSVKDQAKLEIGELSAFELHQNTNQFGDEQPTGKWELWSWWGFYFANNSAGTLSYAPLSKSLIYQLIMSIFLVVILTIELSFPICARPSRLQWQRSHQRLQ